MIKYFNILFFVATIYAIDCSDLVGYVENNTNDYCIPENFYFNSSMLQAAYFFLDVRIEDSTIDSDDWVGAFNENVCVGARKWDTSQCGNDICEVPVLGQDSELTQGYMLSGQIPIFKIFRASDLSYHVAEASEDIPWENLGTPIIDMLSIACIGEIDECGICNGLGIIYECGCEYVELGCDEVCGSGAMEGCNGICYSANEILNGEGVFNDCNGVCGGDAYLDCTGVCDNNPNNDVGHDFDQDGICDTQGDVCVGSQYYDAQGNLICLEVEQPSSLSLKQNYPNPFNPVTYIEFDIDEANYVSLIIYDLHGNQVKKLVNEFLQKDSYKITWDGRDDDYRKSPSGIYIASLEISGIFSSKKLTLIK